MISVLNLRLFFCWGGGLKQAFLSRCTSFPQAMTIPSPPICCLGKATWHGKSPEMERDDSHYQCFVGAVVYIYIWQTNGHPGDLGPVALKSEKIFLYGREERYWGTGSRVREGSSKSEPTRQSLQFLVGSSTSRLDEKIPCCIATLTIRQSTWSMYQFLFSKEWVWMAQPPSQVLAFTCI